MREAQDRRNLQGMMRLADIEGGRMVLLLQGQQIKQQDVSAWMTGIQEVELPLDYKLKNIEETEAAKKQLLASAGAGPGRQAHSIARPLQSYNDAEAFI